MIEKRYETRINSDDLVTIEKVWSKRILEIPADTQFRDSTVVHRFCYRADPKKKEDIRYDCETIRDQN